MADLNKEALDIWGSLKPMIDEEIASRTQGMVQRRKAKVTTAPSLVTNTIGVTEAFGQEIFLPFVTNIASAKVGDFVWIEWMYGASNAFVSCFAEVDEKDFTVAGVLDVVPRRCYATLSSAGWYRVLVYNAVDSGATTGGSGLVVDFNIQRETRAENHSITLRCASTGLISFVNEQSKSYLCYIDKIRYVYDSTNLKAYVDIHYTGSDLPSTPVGVDFSVHCSSLYMQESIVSGNFAAAAASPVSPATVLTEYTFAANTETTGSFTGESGVTISEADIKRSGNVVYVHFYAQKSWSANTEYTVGSLSGVPFPNKHIRWLAGGGSAAYYATTPVYAILDTAGTLKIYPSAAIGAVNITVSYII